MAITIQSTSSQTFTTVTDVGTTGEFTVTFPSGLTVGDMMVVIAQSNISSDNIGAPVGWAGISIPNEDPSSVTEAFYKVADSSDVSAGSGTFTTANDAATVGWLCYRLNGTATTQNPVIDSDGYVDNLSSETTVTGTISLTPPSGTLLLAVISTEQATTVPTLSNYSYTGQTVTLTERYEDSSPSDAQLAVIDGITSTTGTLTAFSFDLSASSSYNYQVSVLAIYPQQDASTSLTLTTTTNSAFTPTVSAGANASPTLTSATNTKFDPTVDSFNPQKWTTVTKS